MALLKGRANATSLRSGSSDLSFDAPRSLTAGEDLDVRFRIAAALHVQLRPDAVAREAPEVGGADDLVAVDHPLRAQVRPLVGAAGLHHARCAGGGPPDDKVALADSSVDHLTGPERAAINEVNPLRLHPGEPRSAQPARR